MDRASLAVLRQWDADTRSARQSWPTSKGRVRVVEVQSREEADEVKAEWSHFIAGLRPWNVFGGMTYDPKKVAARALTARGWAVTEDGFNRFMQHELRAVPPDVAKSHVYKWLQECSADLNRRIDGVIALEYHKSGWPHFHPLLFVGQVQGHEFKGLWRRWFDRHGYIKLEVPRSIDEVAAYAAKYLSKDIGSGDVLMTRYLQQRRFKVDDG